MASDNRNRGYGDGEHTRMIGVRNRIRTVEIKKLYEGGFSFYKDVKCSEEVAGMMHDLARMYSGSSGDQKRLNTPELVRRIIRQDYPDLTTSSLFLDIDKTLELFSGKFLTGFVGRHPVRRVGGTLKERADAMTKDVVELAPLAFRELKDKIASEHSSRRGRQRTDLHEIHDPVVQDDDLQELMATIGAKDEALKAKDKLLKEKDVALKAKQDEIEALKMELYYNAGRPRAANVTPFKRGFAEREGIIIQNDSDAGVSASQWMDMCLK